MGFKIQHALKTCNIGSNGFPSNLTRENTDIKASKIQQNQEEKGFDEKKSSVALTVSQSLFDLTAMLIKYGVIALEDIWSHIEHTLKKDENGKDEIE